MDLFSKNLEKNFFIHMCVVTVVIYVYYLFILLFGAFSMLTYHCD